MAAAVDRGGAGIALHAKSEGQLGPKQPPYKLPVDFTGRPTKQDQSRSRPQLIVSQPTAYLAGFTQLARNFHLQKKTSIIDRVEELLSVV